ncbi:carboxypeptidase regulatory-like domain-containing protein [Nocardioides sp. C4-1]|uniref:MSCRAMM family protein n=1 Tax=Nocardioides sp. C4-1 TaxID=3151851 RepID=UPI003264DF38
MTPRVRTLAALAAPALALVVLTAGAAHALTDRWSDWDPLTGRSNDYATTLRQAAVGFPAVAVASDSRGAVQIASGASTFLGPGTPPGAKYGSSAGRPYLVLRPRADNAGAPSRTTYTFEHPSPQTGWAFVLGDVDADQVQVEATGVDGTPVPAATIDSWFRGTFNHAGGADVPRWQPATATLVGNAAALDTDGASGWFEPTQRLTSLTLVFTRRAGFPVYQTWFVSRARPVTGTVTDVSAGGCAPTAATVDLVAPWGETIATATPDATGRYSLGEVATQDGYVVRVSVPPSCAVVGPAERPVDTRFDDGDPRSVADFSVRAVVPQPVSGTVRDGAGQPVAGVEVSIAGPGGTVSTTTGPDGTYLVDGNAVGTGYAVSISVPDGYRPGPAGTEIAGIEVDDVPVTGQDFVVLQLAAVSGTVTGGGGGLGGVRVTLTPAGGGTPLAVVTRGDGTYDLTGLAAGDYTLAVDPPDGYTGATSRPVTISDADLVDQDFALGRPGALAGTVSDDDGPVAGVVVEVDGPGGPVRLTTDEAGGYYLGDLGAGSYTVTVEAPPGTRVDGAGDLDASVTSAGEVVGGLDFALVDDASSPPPTDEPTDEPTDKPTGATEEPTGGTDDASGPGTDAGGGASEDPATGTALPSTGGPSSLWLLLAGAALAGGTGLIVHSRRLGRARR